MLWIIGWKLTLPEILKTAKAVSDHSLKLNATNLLRANSFWLEHALQQLNHAFLSLLQAST